MKTLIFFWIGLLVASSHAKISSGDSENNFIIENRFATLKKYEPKWSDLDTRPLPEWYDRAKIGIFLHWGVFSVPGFGSEWFWANWLSGDSAIKEFMKKNYRPGTTYQDLAHSFTAEFFDPTQWADLFLKSGAKYVVLTTKHHEGFTLFPSKRSFSWNAADVGPKRDLVGDLGHAVKHAGMKFGVYHSLYEWYNPIYLEDKKLKYKTSTYPDTKLWPDIKQLINDYQPSVLWVDGDWEANDTYWKSTELLAWLYNESPVKDEIVVNDRWGRGIPCHHGDFYNCNDRYNPGTLQKHKWENAFTIDSKSWGYRRNINITEILTMDNLLKQVVSTVSCGGNALINVGPTKEGTIAPIFQERLLDLGKWLSVNGEAIYNSSPWTYQNDSLNGNVWYTCAMADTNMDEPTPLLRQSDELTAIYAIFLQWPGNNILVIHDITTYVHSGIFEIRMLGDATGDTLDYNIKSGRTEIQLPSSISMHTKSAWTLKFAKRC